MNKTAKRVLEKFAFGWLFFSHWALWFIGFCVVLGHLSDYVPNLRGLRGSAGALWLALVPAFCISLGWCRYRVRNRTIQKNTVYFIGMFLRFWLIWLFIFLAIVMGVADAFLSVNTWSPWAAGLVVWSCVGAAFCVSIGWSIYSVRKDYLGTAEYPTKDFIEFPHKFLEFLRKFFAFFVIKDTKRS
ncbi:MAG: hypothetical protein OXH31_01630 [Gammaproteobacteria bacterium]|nr:hypothetical protein [Gammaproteobacteria bacterium]